MFVRTGLCTQEHRLIYVHHMPASGEPLSRVFVEVYTQAPSSFYKIPAHMSVNMCALVFPYPCRRSGHKGMAHTGTTNMMMPCMVMYLSLSFGHQIVAGDSNWTTRLVSTAADPPPPHPPAFRISASRVVPLNQCVHMTPFTRE